MERLEPWLDDGNIILAVQGKCFRVHRSVLAASSEVFRDMFAIPHSDNTGGCFIDGCPVVHLQDASDDVQIVLKTLYARIYVFSQNEPILIAVLTAFLRLGTKYAIRQLFKEALRRLPPGVPLLEYVDKISDMPGKKDTLYPHIGGGDPYGFMLMDIASEIGHLSTVAITVYWCCIACPPSYILDGYDFNGIRYTLSSLHQRYCVIGQRYVADTRKELLEVLAQSALFASGMCDYANKLNGMLSYFLGRRGPFMVWPKGWDGELCKRCKVEVRRAYKQKMTRLWEGFPLALGLGSWDDLDKDVDVSETESKDDDAI